MCFSVDSMKTSRCPTVHTVIVHMLCVQVCVHPVSTLTTASSPACPVCWERTSLKWDAPSAFLVEETWWPSAAVLLPSRSVRPKVWRISVIFNGFSHVFVLFFLSQQGKSNGSFETVFPKLMRTYILFDSCCLHLIEFFMNHLINDKKNLFLELLAP